MKPSWKMSVSRISCSLSLWVFLGAGSVYGEVETAGVFGDWGVWSGWYWPFNDTKPPNLYGTGEALSRYDSFSGGNSQAWEYDHHGPTLNQPDWAGHCHAWCGASVWEYMPTASRVLGNVTFRARDLAALMTEAYYNDTLATEISVFRPSPGLLWRYLRQELLGEDSLHGHPMALIGNLTQHRGEVWNFPVFQYEVDYAQDSSATFAGTITLWFADDGCPSIADSLGVSSMSVTYPFRDVSLDATGVPLDSGFWNGTDPSQYPTSIWRPYYAVSWTNYVENPEFDAAHLSQILDLFDLGDALNANSLQWISGGDAPWYGQAVTAHDLASAAQSGLIGNDGTSWFRTAVAGPGTVTFWWKVSSEPGCDFLKFLVDGQEQSGGISGEVDWQFMSYAITGTGIHSLEWVYAKDHADSSGSDCAWVDQVCWIPVPGVVTVSTSSSPSGGGSTGGGGTTNCGASVTVCAFPNPGYAFANWAEDGAVVSSSSTYTCPANSNRTLVANFSARAPVITFARIENQFVVTWATNWTGYLLESCTNAGPIQVWNEVAPAPAIVGDSFYAANPADEACRFYRLRHP